MRGMSMRDILKERLKETPNLGKLVKFKRRRNSLIKAQLLLYLGNDAITGECADKYRRLVGDELRWNQSISN